MKPFYRGTSPPPLITRLLLLSLCLQLSHQILTSLRWKDYCFESGALHIRETAISLKPYQNRLIRCQHLLAAHKNQRSPKQGDLIFHETAPLYAQSHSSK